MHHSTVIADKFLEYAEKNNATLTPMQLLKLVYIAHGWMLAYYSKPLISDRVEAWQYGPVIPELYQVIKKACSNPVKRDFKINGQLDEVEENIISEVYKFYGYLSGPALSRLTHAAGTPWSRTYRKGHGGDVISNDMTQDYFQLLYKKASEYHEEQQ